MQFYGQQPINYSKQQESLSNIDPSMLTLGYQNIKEEDLLDINDVGMMDNSILSPLSTSPLDHDLLERASKSLNGTPFGTPGLTNGFYSMSMPPQPTTNFQTPDFIATSLNSFTGKSNTSNNSVDQEEANRQTLDALNEKRRKRRESHNAVERRRRDHINEKIQELSSLLPEFASDAQNKPNKGVILRRSVEYIRHMQVFAARQMDRTLELEQCLMTICQKKGITEAELGLSFPLGTPIQMPVLNQNNNMEELEDL